jgi:hypothetical protein
MRAMELTGSEIVKIIKTARESGVSRIKVGELDVSFGEAFVQEKPLRIHYDLTQQAPHTADDDNDGLILTKEEQEALDEMEDIINDPVAWELKQLA